jgi:hypothetical protein
MVLLGTGINEGIPGNLGAIVEIPANAQDGYNRKESHDELALGGLLCQTLNSEY